MRRIIGGLLLVVGAILLFVFGVQGTFYAQGASAPSFNLPFSSLGAKYPGDVLMFLGAAWALLIGLVFVFIEPKKAPPPTMGESAASRYAQLAGADKKGGFAAKTLLVTALLMASFLFAAFIGAKTHQDTRLVGLFTGIALVQVVTGLFLLLLALLEKPKNAVALLLGSVLYLGGAAVGVLAFVQGGA